MDYKMIAIDIDDTLLLPNGDLSEQVKNDIILVQKQGIRVVLASGRPTFGMISIANELDLHKYGGYILSFNGSKIIECLTNKVLYEKSLDKQQIINLYNLAIKYECFFHTYDGDNIITNHDNPYTYIESEITGMNIKFYDDLIKNLPEKCVKAIIMQAPEHLQEVEKMLKPTINDMYMTRSKPFFLEFMDKSVNKGETIIKLAEYINIDMNKIIAIGDSYNDIDMIKNVGMGIAMGNAISDIKSIANFVTDTNENDGVSKAIHKFLLI